MPKKRRPENKGLPVRWQFTHGAYYFRVPPGLEHRWENKKRFRLGKTLPESYREWAKRLDSVKENARTVADLLDRYLLEVVPTKAPATQQTNVLFVNQLRAIFGEAELLSIKPTHVYQYVDKRKVKIKDPKSGRMKGGRIVAHREIEVLSHAFTKAVEWGYIDRHPFKGEVRLEGEAPRDRYVEDWEIIEALSLDSQRKKGSILTIHAYIRLKLMTGMARSDLLRLTDANVTEDGIHIKRHKTASSSGKQTIYTWTPELRAAIEDVKLSRPATSHLLFCKRDGTGYFNEETGDTSGWNSIWQRFMDRVLSETKVVERFTEHDLRAKCASDAETVEHARALLSHVDLRTTDAIYRRKPEKVTPLTGGNL